MPPPKRSQSQTDRDIEGFSALKERLSEVPEYVCEDVTGRFEGQVDPEELISMRMARAEQNPAHRIALIETEQKEQSRVLNETRDDVALLKVSVAEIRGDQKAQNKSLTGIERTLERMAQREDVKYAARAEVDKAEKIAKITTRAERTKFWFQIIAAIVGGGAIGKILNWLGVF